MQRSRLPRIPSSLSVAKKAWINIRVPYLRHRRAIKGAPPRKGRIWKQGMTDEEKLARIAPSGTMPERILYGWLVTHDISFTFQEGVLGGRMPGGAVIDFVLYDLFPPMAIRIMSYWHESPDRRLADEIQRAVLTDLGYNVEDVWEWEINTVEKVNNKMRELLYGFNDRVGASYGVGASGVGLNTGAGPGTQGKDEPCPFCNSLYCRRIHFD